MRIILKMIIVISCISSMHMSFGQCSYPFGTTGPTRPVPTGQGEVNILEHGTRFLSGMESGKTYRISTCGYTQQNTIITMYTEGQVTAATHPIAFNDDACGTQSELLFVPPTSGTYPIYISSSSCATLPVAIIFEIELVAEVEFQGLDHKPLGNGILNVEQAFNDLIISNIGNTGSDGVEINLGESKGLHLESELPESSAIPDGASLKSVVLGPAGGMPNQVLGALSIKRTGNVFQETPFFSGAQTYQLILMNNGVEVFSQAGMTGPAIEIEVEAQGPNLLGLCFHGINGLQISRNKRHRGGAFAIRVVGGPTVAADFVIYKPINAPDIEDGVTGIQITSNSIDKIRVKDEWLMMFDRHLPNKAQGDATLNAIGGELVVKNIGTTNKDGVLADFLDFIVGEVNTFNWVQKVDGGTGSVLTQTAFGELNGIPDQIATTAKIKDVGFGLRQFSADFSPLGSMTQTIEVYNDGVLVQRSTGLPNGSIVLITDPDDDDDLEPAKFIMGNSVSENIRGFTDQTCTWTWEFNQDVTISVNPNVIGDFLVIKEEESAQSVDVDVFSGLGLIGNEVNSLTIQDEHTLRATVCSSDINVADGFDSDVLLEISGGTPPYDVLWSNGLTTADITVSTADAPALTVVVTDAKGAQTKAFVQLNVIDISCGNNKVLLCHRPPGNPNNASTLCINRNAINGHIGHGDFLGACENGLGCQAVINKRLVQTHQASVLFDIAPNPFSTFTRVYFKVPVKGMVSVEVLDVTGKSMTTIYSGLVKGEKKQQAIFNNDELSSGVYFLQLKLNGQILHTKQVVITK